MKKSVFIFVFILIQSLAFTKDYNCNFKYKVAGKSGIGKCSDGTDPVVKIDSEKKEITFPDFVFTESKTIPEFTVTGVEITKRSDGSIEIKKDSFEVNQSDKKITGKKLYGTVKGNELELEVTLKVGKMPFNLKVKYFTE